MTAHRISPHLKDLQPPAGMGGVKAWLCWRAEKRGDSDKILKVPYYADRERRRGAQGTPEDRDRLVTFDAARAAAIRFGFTGVGFALLPGSTVVALDFDNVVQDEVTFKSISYALEETYAEFSPSGNGIRAFVLQGIGTDQFNNLKSHAKNGNPFTFEVFATSGFVTFTGNVLPPGDGPQPVAKASDKIRKLYEGRLAKRGPVFGKGVGASVLGTHSSTSEPLGYSIEEINHILKDFNPSASYDEWIEVGMCLHHEMGGSQDGFDAWHAWSATGDSYVSEGDCESHWLSFRRTDGAKTMRTLLKRGIAAGASIASPQATADDFDDMTGEDDAQSEGGPAGGAEPDRFQPIQFADYLKRPPIGWLVKGLIQEGDPVNLFGPSGSGKSFVAFDIVMAIARGVPWRGMRVKRGRVVYICAEGAGGFRTRMDAYREYHGIEPTEMAFHVIPAAPSLIKPKDVKDLIKAIEGVFGAEVIVVDTLAQTTPGGDENSSEDMGAALTAVQQLSRHFKATTILVHHTGKDVNRGARGWSGIKGAMGTQLEVIVGENGQRCLHVEKLKDGEGGANHTFKLHQVKLGKDAEGDELTSCVVLADGEVPAGRPASAGKIYKTRNGPVELLALDALSKLEVGDSLVTLPDFIAAVVALDPNEDGEPERRLRMRAKRAIESLAKKKQIDHVDGVYFSVKA